MHLLTVLLQNSKVGWVADVTYNDNMQWVLNLCLAYIMFGISLDLKWSNFKAVIAFPKGFLVGVLSQYVWLPLVAIALVMIGNIDEYIALGIILVAVCPGGNMSNFFTALANGNLALSIALSMFSSLMAFALTPYIFAGIVNLLSIQTNIQFEISPFEMMKTIAFIMLLPCVLGLFAGKYFRDEKGLVKNIIRITSVIILLGFIAIALIANIDAFIERISSVIWWVLIFNSLGLIGGYTLARIFKQNRQNRISISIETGIQNTGLGLALIFTFFNHNDELKQNMAMVAATWGIWHLISGFAVSQLLKVKDV
ncbi:MAG: bile acid:sodium symporter family protein [Bacteroidetes bacterium]|nr:bile acid:sodium symporter family protein [Bacteroidota bacterium]